MVKQKNNKVIDDKKNKINPFNVIGLCLIVFGLFWFFALRMGEGIGGREVSIFDYTFDILLVASGLGLFLVKRWGRIVGLISSTVSIIYTINFGNTTSSNVLITQIVFSGIFLAIGLYLLFNKKVKEVFK